jgi:DNA mismatch repair ATPase MutS
MSDPLSIAAGIAGFLSLGIQVTQTLVDFYSVYRSQDTDIAKITQNMENLQSIFRSLETAIHQRQSQTNAEELLQEVDKATQRCHEIIRELQSECQKLQTDQKLQTESSTSLKVRFQAAGRRGRRVTYPFRKSTIQKIEEDVGAIRENLLFALSVLQFKSHNQIEDDVLAVRSLLERTNSSQISFVIRTWLQAPDASSNHNAMYAKHHPRTGQWFINSHQFANWQVERSSFLWLNGFAGCASRSSVQL